MGRLKNTKNVRWRKNDISEIERFLEEERKRNIFLPIGAIGSASNDQLFQLDKGASLDKLKPPTSRKEKFQNLVLHVDKPNLDPSIPATKGTLKFPPKPQPFLKGMPQKKSVRMMKTEKERRQSLIKKSGRSFSDIWSGEKPKPEKEFYFAKIPAAKKPYRVVMPSALPAVPIPDPGNSYNPDYQEHQDVLGEALAASNNRAEKKRALNKELHLLYHTTKRPQDKTDINFRTLSNEISRNMASAPIKEQIQDDEQKLIALTTVTKKHLGKKGKKRKMTDLFQDEDEETGDRLEQIEGPTPKKLKLEPLPSLKSARESIYDMQRNGAVLDMRAVFSRHFSSKLSKTQRNKLENIKQLRRQIRHQNSERRRMHDIDRLPELLAHLDTAEKKAEGKRALKKRKEQREKTRTKRLSKYQFADIPQQPFLTDELPGRLRLLPKPKTNLLEESYVNFQRRNIIETRVPVKYYAKRNEKTYVRGSMRL